jgi:hypothetical protein
MIHGVIVRNLFKTIRGNITQPAQRLSVGCAALYANLLINGMFNATFSGRANAPFMMLMALVVISDRLAQEVPHTKWVQRPVPAWA